MNQGPIYLRGSGQFVLTGRVGSDLRVDGEGVLRIAIDDQIGCRQRRWNGVLRARVLVLGPVERHQSVSANGQHTQVSRRRTRRLSGR